MNRLSRDPREIRKSYTNTLYAPEEERICRRVLDDTRLMRGACWVILGVAFAVFGYYLAGLFVKTPLPLDMMGGVRI